MRPLPALVAVPELSLATASPQSLVDYVEDFPALRDEVPRGWSASA
jgi:hypothetical protein